MENNKEAINTTLIAALFRFETFVNKKDNNDGPISFTDCTCYLGREENYKFSVFIKAREALNANEWKESWINTGKIVDCVINALNKSDNLVNYHLKLKFEDKIKSDSVLREKAEKVLYNIYCNSNYDESMAFEEACELFGRTYELIAFLFFIKDDTRFLPVSSGHFEKALNDLGINISLLGKCSYGNYIEFINIISNIKSVMKERLHMKADPRLIDAHSFVWITQKEEYKKWIPNDEENDLIETKIEESINGGPEKREGVRSIFNRSIEVVTKTRLRANGICQLCKNKAPFNDKNGEPFLEVHHVIWLSQGGTDDITNTVALCPNCHKRMHILDNEEDKNELLHILNSYKINHL